MVMSDNVRAADASLDAVLAASRPPLSDEMRRTLKSVREFIERAREHHARTGEWPPDPLLDEVEEMRRRVEAEHGNDPRKVLEWYIQAGKRHITSNGSDTHDEDNEQPDPVSPL
jgi:hypothetical protein